VDTNQHTINEQINISKYKLNTLTSSQTTPMTGPQKSLPNQADPKKTKDGKKNRHANCHPPSKENATPKNTPRARRGQAALGPKRDKQSNAKPSQEPNQCTSPISQPHGAKTPRFDYRIVLQFLSPTPLGNPFPSKPNNKASLSSERSGFPAPLLLHHPQSEVQCARPHCCPSSCLALSPQDHGIPSCGSEPSR
jgi:hypothetical protein